MEGHFFFPPFFFIAYPASLNPWPRRGETKPPSLSGTAVDFLGWAEGSLNICPKAARSAGRGLSLPGLLSYLVYFQLFSFSPWRQLDFFPLIFLFPLVSVLDKWKPSLPTRDCGDGWVGWEGGGGGEVGALLLYLNWLGGTWGTTRVPNRSNEVACWVMVGPCLGEAGRGGLPPVGSVVVWLQVCWRADDLLGAAAAPKNFHPYPCSPLNSS